MTETDKTDVTALTVQLLSAYLANNNVAHTDIAGLIRSTKAALTEETSSPVVEPAVPAHVPAVSVRKSLASPDHILSLIDGKPYKTLKRHLGSHGLTPDSYRERYGLAANYPMVAPGFAEQRRAIAERIGLGRRPAVAKAEPKKARGSRSTLKLFNGEAPAEKPAPKKRAPRKAKAADSAA